MHKDKLDLKLNIPFMIIFGIIVVFGIAVSGMPEWLQLVICGIAGWYTRKLGNMWSTFYAALKVSLNNWAKR